MTAQPNRDRPDGVVQDAEVGRPGAGRHLRRWVRRIAGAGWAGHGGRTGARALALADLHGQPRRGAAARLLRDPPAGTPAVVGLPATAAGYWAVRHPHD